MSQKIKKVLADIEKTEDKITVLQAKLDELYNHKTELENLEIIGMIRGSKIDINNLSDAIKAYRDKSGVPFSSEETNLQKEISHEED